MENQTSLTQETLNIINFLKSGNAALFQILGKPDEAKAKAALSKIPHFNEECTPDVICLYVGFEVNTFNNSERNIVLYLFDEKTQHGDFWRGSLSTQYANTANDDGVAKTYVTKTFDQIKKVIDIENTIQWQDLIAKLHTRRFPVWVAKKTSNKTGKEYYAIAALGSGGFEVAAPIGIPTDLNLGALLTADNAAPHIPNQTPQAFPNQPSAFPNQQPQPAAPTQAAPQAAPQNAAVVNPFAKM